MEKFKLGKWNKIEFIAYLCVILFILIQAIFSGDGTVTILSAICGITTTILTGKGVPTCYITGFVGSFLYAYLAYTNMLWGQMILYLGYYVPMQIIGFIQWKKHLKQDEYEIIKTKLTTNEIIMYSVIIVSGILVISGILNHYKDIHPVLDGITSVLSVFGVFLTVKRVIEQWYIWIVVNALSLLMWIYVALSGQHVWATVIMWAVYLFLGFYFCSKWKKELN